MGCNDFSSCCRFRLTATQHRPHYRIWHNKKRGVVSPVVGFAAREIRNPVYPSRRESHCIYTPSLPPSFVRLTSTLEPPHQNVFFEVLYYFVYVWDGGVGGMKFASREPETYSSVARPAVALPARPTSGRLPRSALGTPAVIVTYITINVAVPNSLLLHKYIPCTVCNAPTTQY